MLLQHDDSTINIVLVHYYYYYYYYILSDSQTSARNTQCHEKQRPQNIIQWSQFLAG